MLEWARRHPRVLIVAGITVVVLLAGATFARVGSPDDDDPCDAPRAAPRAELARLPPRLSFRQIGTITRVVKYQRYVTVFAVTTKPLDEVTIRIQDAVTAAGYRPGGMDNEGFEAEVFFTTGQYAAGQARVRRSLCRGRWEIELVLLAPAAAGA